MLQDISLESLQEEIAKRREVEFLFEKDNKKYYDVSRYNKLLSKFAVEGVPLDFTPIEFNSDGTPKSIEPKHVVINLDAFISNRVYVVRNEYHIVHDTRTVRESETGNITLAFIPEIILKEDPKKSEGYVVSKGMVSRENFLKNYNRALGIDDMLAIFRIVDKHQEELLCPETSIPFLKKSLNEKDLVSIED